MTDVPMTSPAPAQPNKRPFTLKAVCVLLVLRGLLSGLLVALIVFDVAAEEVSSLLDTVHATVIAIESVVLAVLFLVAAVGLWQMRPWAWRFTMIYLGVLLIFSLWNQLNGERSLITSIGLLLNIFIVFYLIQGDVRALFVTDAPAP